MSALHALDVDPELFKTTAHPGLWLDRFCPVDAIGKGEEKGEAQRQHLYKVCSLKPAADDYTNLLKRHLAGCAAVGISTQKLPLTLRWRMAIHLSRASALENAATCLHPIYGFAFLPGSGLKGLARAYASLLWDRCGGAGGKDIEGVPAARFTEHFLAIFGWAPNDERRGKDVTTAAGIAALRDPAFGGHVESAAAQRGSVIFHDAWANAYPQLEVDVATCHFPKYYSEPGKNPPGDWQEPNPVTFLTIAPGTQFTFCLSGADQALVDQALQWLFGGLYWLGAGAKTAAGYGAFVLDEGLIKQDQLREEVARNEAVQRAEAQRLEAVKRAEHERAAHGLTVIAQGLKADEILVVAVPSDPSQAGSRTGYTLLYASSGWTRGQLFSYKKDPLPKGLVFKLIKKGTTNDKGQIEVQGPVVPTNAPAPV